MKPKDAAKELLRRRLARKDYGAWCDHALAPLGLKPANHHRLLIRELQDVADGKTQRLMVNMPPGSAKSTFGSMLFPAWLMASKPNISIIGASNTANLAESFSRRVMGFARDNTPELGYTLTREAADDWETSNGGRYRAIGVGGAISGRRADMVVIDDPTRSRADAESSTIRENQWNWFTADLRTRLKPDASIVVIMTRWHLDDLGGRLLERQPGLWRVVSLPAIAEEADPLGRKPGEWLWEDDAYGYGREIRKVHSEYMEAGASRDWAALYQQKPVLTEGNIFKPSNISIIDAIPAGTTLVRAWDLAATSDIGGRNPDWTRGALMGRTRDGGFVLADLVSLRGGPEEVEAIIRATASRDGRGIEISLPQDPGQAGVAQIKYFARRLAGHKVHTSRETGDKATRAMPFASQVNIGNVSMVRASWNHEALDEMGSFPGGMHDDIVDSCSRAFDRIANSGGALERARMLTQRTA